MSFIILIAVLFILIGISLSIRLTNKQKTLNSPPTSPTSVAAYISPTSPPIPINLTRAKVAKVIDGDTIELADKTRVRYIGINTPELSGKDKLSECFATQSAYINRQLVEGQEIGLENDLADRDKYGRLLRYVYIDDVFINEFLVRQGYARLETIPPDVKYAQTFEDAQKEARGNNRGLWGKCK